MPRITKELLRSRAEHNEGCLANLEEVTLHQFELEKIELLEQYCRHLKILYLQNNIIEKMEGLNKLKELEYLNLALNNISRIEGIQGCESLKKLDFTVNFIDLEELEDSTITLSRLPQLKELFLVGNPCLDWTGCRDFIISLVPTLESIDGKEITPTDRIRAGQQYDSLLVDLHHRIEMRKIAKAAQKEIDKNKEEEIVDESIPPAERKSGYSKESRREMYMEMAADKEKREREKNPEKFKEPAPPTAMFRPDGDIRQCNEGKFKFTLREWDDAEWSFFDIQVPKYLDTSLLDVNINPKWVSIRIKGKLTQLRLSEEIIVEKSETQRSQVTGILSIKMKKHAPNEFIQAAQKKEDEEKQKKLAVVAAAKTKIEQDRLDRVKLCDKIEQKELLKQQDHTTFDDIPDLE